MSDELYCKKCAMCWERSEYGNKCPECGVEGKPSSFEADANAEMGIEDYER